MNEIFFCLVIVFIIYSIFFGECGLFLSHREIMRNQRQKNAKKGIVMRPNWWYLRPDGKREMSPTGKLKNKIVR